MDLYLDKVLRKIETVDVTHVVCLFGYRYLNYGSLDDYKESPEI